MYFSKNKKLKQLIADLLTKLLEIRASEECRTIVKEFLEYNEFGLAFEQIVYELNENNIRITSKYYFEIKKVGDLMKLDENEYRPRLEKLIIKV